MPEIRLNGKPHSLTLPMTITGLLDSLDMAGKPVVVELDGVAIFPRDFPQTCILDGAIVEIVTLAAGG